MKDYLGLARAYEAGVVAGEIPACKWVRLACARNQKDVGRIGTPGFPYDFDHEKAVRICMAAEQLPHTKGEKAGIVGEDDKGRHIWNPIQLEPWQCWLLTTLFGWVHETTRLRRFRTGLVLVPRKNAKSTLAAIVLLFMLTADGEVGAECYSAATTRDQAKVVAEIAWEMARKSPGFTEYFGVRVGARTARALEVPETASKAMPLSADAHSLDGLNVHLGVVDELHAHKTRHVWDVLETATGARTQPLMLPITTAGVDTGGICYELLTYLHKLLDGVLEDETFFGINYTIDEGDRWEDEATWRKANPNYGVSVKPDDLERKARKAKASPASINNFLTKHLNVWVKSEANWMPMEAWHACGDSSLTLESLKGYPCWLGVDLAEVKDIAAVVALFKLPEKRWAVIGRFYLPEAAIDKSPIAQYSGWVRTGHLIRTSGSAADYQRIEQDIWQWCQDLKVQAVCFDRALAAQMGQQLERRLGRRPPVITVSQNIAVMTPAMQTLEQLVLERRFVHGNDPALTWMASNVVVKPSDRDEQAPLKAGGKDSHHKIDGIVALLTALSQAIVAPEPRRSVGVMVV